jgi:hypothetical protein
MEQHEHERLGDYAAERNGVFTRADAVRLGVTTAAIDKRLSLGLYRRLDPAVYTIAGSPQTIQQRLTSLVLSFPEIAAISHQTAAELWGLTSRGFRTIEVVTTRWDRVRRPGVKVHESLDLLPADVVEQGGIPVTSPVRTVVDVGASNKWVVESALEQGIRNGLFTLHEVQAFVDRVARRGRRGVGVIRPLVEARRRWDSATESALEDLFRRVVADVGIPDACEQYVVMDDRDRFVCRADFAYPDAGVLIELDSEAHHLDRMAFRRDRSKQNGAAVLGWTVLRYTWWDLKDNPGRVVADLRSLLTARSPRSCGSAPT